MSHTCHAVGCSVEVPPKMFMCLAHWRKVPRKEQITVWNVYRPGQEIDKQPSIEYVRTTRLVIAHLAATEYEACCKNKVQPDDPVCDECAERYRFVRAVVAAEEKLAPARKADGGG